MGESHPELLVDRAASARPLEENELAAWASNERVFVSSVIEGYEDERVAVAQAIEAVGAEPVMFERFGGRDSDPNHAYLSEVVASTIYIGLLGARYGRPLPSRFSATHEEYHEAERSGLRISIWAEEVEREGSQQSFFDEVRVFNVTGSFSSPSDLRDAVERRLREIAAQALSPWCKLGDAVFRAREISVGAGQAKITAAVRDAAVADSIITLEGGLSRPTAGFAYWAGVYDCELTNLSSVSRAGGLRELTIELAVKPPPGGQTYTMNSMSWPEMTKRAIEVSWFGAEQDRGVMGFELGIADPFATLAALGVSEEAVRPIAFLLCQEVLVRERQAARLDGFQLGRSINGRRRLALTWIEPARYSNDRPSSHAVEGTVALP